MTKTKIKTESRVYELTIMPVGSKEVLTGFTFVPGTPEVVFPDGVKSANLSGQGTAGTHKITMSWEQLIKSGIPLKIKL